MKNCMHNLRLALLFACFLIAFSGLWSCTTSTAEENAADPLHKSNARANKHLIVFIDKTLSNTTNPEVMKKQQKALKRLIKDHLKNNGDFLGAYAIHESTGPGSSIIQEKLNLPLDTLKVGAMTKQANISQFNMLVEGKVKACAKYCNEELLSQNTQASSQWTDLWSTLDLIGQHTSGLPKQDKITVLYISDMIESMDTKNDQRRDFHTNKIKDLAQAREFATTDLEQIRKSYLTHLPAHPENITVKIWLPYGATDNNNSRAMIAYWEEIFKRLDMNIEATNAI